MIDDPAFPILLKILRQHGWIEVDNALYAPGATIWIELDANWPESVSKFRESMLGRMEKLLNRAAVQEDSDLTTSILDTSDLLGCLALTLVDRPGFPS